MGQPQTPTHARRTADAARLLPLTYPPTQSVTVRVWHCVTAFRFHTRAAAVRALAVSEDAGISWLDERLRCGVGTDEPVSSEGIGADSSLVGEPKELGEFGVCDRLPQVVGLLPRLAYCQNP